MKSDNTSTRRLVVISMLAAFGLIIFVFESFFPLFSLPWFRPGLGNIATILALLFFGLGDALKVTLLRVVLGALILGRLFTPVFLFALCGGLASTLVMAFILRYVRIFGPVGMSVLGAVTHNSVQLFIAYLFFVKSSGIFIFIPVFVAAGVVTGMLTGLISAVAFEKTQRRVITQSYI